jgi:hypothetical protein
LSFVVFLGLINGPRQLTLLLELIATWFSWLVMWNWFVALRADAAKRQSILVDSSFQVCLFLLPALFLTALSLGNAHALSIKQRHIGWYWLVVGGETLFVMIAERITEREKLAPFFRAIIWATAPLVLLLPGVFFGNEIQWSLVPQKVSLVAVYRGILAVTFGLSGVFSIYAYFSRRISPRWCHRLISCWIFPNIILFLVLSTVHRQTISLETFDYLHWGNLVVPAQQLIDHGRLPFVDAWYARNLRDLLIGLLNGFFSWKYEPLGAILWAETVINCTSTLVVYGILATLVCPLGAFLSALVFPAREFFSGYYAGSAFPCLFMFLLLKKPNTLRLVFFWLVTVFSFAWMASDGSAAIPVAILLVGSLAVLLPAWRNSIPWRAFSYVFGAAAILYFAVLAAKGHSIYETLSLIGSFAYVDSVVGSFERFNDGLSTTALVQYGVFPLIAIVSIVLALRRIQKTQSISIGSMMVFFIAAISLLLFKRAFARHCLIEGFQDHFFWATGVFLMLQLFGRNRRGILAAFAAICLIVGICYRTWEPTLKPRVLFSPHEWKATEERVVVNLSMKQQISRMKAFFDHTLGPTQTFAELVNAHLLYSLVRRPYAFFHHAVQIIQSDPAQAVYLAQWQRKLQKQEVPLVVTRMTGYWGSALDGMPLGLSVYRLSEFLYQYYEPYMYVEGLEIWKQKDFTLQEPQSGTETITPLYLPQSPASASNNVAIDGKAFRATGPDPWVCGILDNPGSHLFAGEQYAIRIVYRSSKAGPWTINPMTRKGDSSSGPTYEFLADASDKEQSTYLVPSDTFRTESFADFRVDIPDDSTFEIIAIEAYPGMKPGFGTRIETTHQELDFKLLPYVWANYDSKSSLEEKRTLHTLQIAPAPVSSANTLRLDIPVNIDKTTGNYLLLQATGAQNAVVDLRLSDGRRSGLLHFRLKGKKTGEFYLVRISSLWVWYSRQPLHIEVSTTSQRPLEVSHAAILKGD